MPILNVTPEKRVFLSIISEYDLKRSICELIDNAIDLGTKQKITSLKINLELDAARQTISIEDNAGGIEESKLDHIVSPGKTSNHIGDDVIGYFGVGSKRAVVALAEDITISSRFNNLKTFSIHFDDDWINVDPSWLLNYVESKKTLPTNTTRIELFKLRTPLTDNDIQELKTHLAEVYAQFIKIGIIIIVNGETLEKILFDNSWTYAPDYPPSTFTSQIAIDDRSVDVEIACGLIDHSGDPDESYGVFMYCNNRLVARGLVDYTVGFTSGGIGLPHYNISLVRTIVKLKGQSRDMPWNSSKWGVDTKHPIFRALRNSIISVTKNYVQICRKLQGSWNREIFPFKNGAPVTETLSTIENIPKRRLPAPPPSKPKWEVQIAKKNAPILAKKPWSEGLQDSIIAADMISKTTLSQKNRIALILIDSTLEIAYKEYLVNEKGIGIAAFSKLSNRADIQKEVLKHISVSAVTLKQIEYYYKLRNDLIHQRATPNINDDQVQKYRSVVEHLLKKMFGLKFDSEAL